MEKFLTENGFSQEIVNSLSAQKLDLGKLCRLNKDELEVTCEDLPLTIKEFKKLLMLLEERKSKEQDENRRTPHEYPKEVQLLFRPNPITDRVKFENVILQKIYGFAYEEICFPQFKAYVTE